MKVHAAFRDFDGNGDGYVDQQELRLKNFSDDQIRSIIFKYDKDGDGRLNYPEFAAFYDVPIL